MLSFDIREAGAKAVQVEGSIPAGDEIWEEDDFRPAGALQVRARVSPAGGGRFYLSGSLGATIELDCRRCLKPVSAEVDEEIHAVFAPQDGEDMGDPDVFPFDPNVREVDLRPAMRELWLLAAPRFVLCQEACRGLCPTCGKDLNAGACECPPERDSRWDALRAPAPSRT